MLMKIGFDNDKYLAMQSAHIRERIAQFDNKLYLEFGGKLFDDYHASRVLPGFQPDSKLQMLLQLKEQAEIVIVISAEDIISSKVRGDYGITYDLDVMRLIDLSRTLPGTDGDRVFLLGQSRGAMMSYRVARRRSDIAAMATIAGVGASTARAALWKRRSTA